MKIYSNMGCAMVELNGDITVSENGEEVRDVHGSLVRGQMTLGGKKGSRDRAGGMTRCKIRKFSFEARCRRQSVTIQATKSLGDKRENVTKKKKEKKGKTNAHTIIVMK